MTYRIEIYAADASSRIVGFEFNSLKDAMEFVEACVECGDDKNEVVIYKKEEE